MMNERNTLLIILILLFSFSSFSEPTKKDDFEGMLLEIHFGEKKSLFLLEKKATGGEVTFTNGGTVSKPAPLSPKNWEFLVSQGEEIEKLKTEGFQCPRSSIELKIKKKNSRESRSSCVESKSVLGQKLNRLSELLLVLF